MGAQQGECTERVGAPPLEADTLRRRLRVLEHFQCLARGFAKVLQATASIRSHVELANDRLGGRRAVDVLANDPADALLRSAHDLRYHALIEPGRIEPRRRRAAEIMEV
jgi:hypothetical protein